MRREPTEITAADNLALNWADADLIKQAIVQAVANGCLPPPCPITGEGTADVALVRRLAKAFAEVNRLAAML